MGVMDKIGTFHFCKKVLDTYNKSDAGCLPRFEHWFNSQDPNQTNQVPKEAIFAYMRQVAVQLKVKNPEEKLVSAETM